MKYLKNLFEGQPAPPPVTVANRPRNPFKRRASMLIDFAEHVVNNPKGYSEVVVSNAVNILMEYYNNRIMG